MKKKKILFFLPPSVGGSERMTITIGRFLPVNEFEVKFVIVGKERAQIASFVPPEYSIIHLPIRSIWDFTVLRMAGVIYKEKPQAVFCSLRYMAIHMIVAAKLFKGIDCIVRSDNDMARAKKLNVFLMRITFPWCKWVIAQQEEMRNELLEWLPLKEDRVVTLHNPIDKATILSKLEGTISPFNNKQVNYVWVARIHHAKGQDVLVKAFSILHKTNPIAHLYMIGNFSTNDKFYQKLINYIAINNLEGYIHFKGYDDNPYKWMKYCSVFVMPSRFEGLPNALIEAMFLGVPVVATKCVPMITRLVNDGINGYSVPVEDPEAMADAMMKATKLESFQFTYHPAEPEDFIQLFRD